VVSEYSTAQLLKSEGDQKSWLIFGQILMMWGFFDFSACRKKKKKESKVCVMIPLGTEISQCRF